VQTPEGRTGIDCNVFNLERFQEINDNIRAPLSTRFFDFLHFGHSRSFLVGKDRTLAKQILRFRSELHLTKDVILNESEGSAFRSFG
jgi:hypothetical protein